MKFFDDQLEDIRRLHPNVTFSDVVRQVLDKYIQRRQEEINARTNDGRSDHRGIIPEGTEGDQ